MCDPCGNEVLSRVPAPDASHIVFVFHRGCGAPTGTSTQVSVLRTGEELRARPSFVEATRSGNALILGERHGAVPVGIEWIDGRRVRLTYHPGLETHLASPQVEGVTVEHVRAGEVRDDNDRGVRRTVIR
jgi:hypothetical protein